MLKYDVFRWNNGYILTLMHQTDRFSIETPALIP